MRKISVPLAVAVLLAGPCLGQQKKRVAIMNFDYSTVYSGISAIFGSHQDVGKGVADLVVEKLVNDATYSVIERKALDKILTEQNFSNSDRVDPTTAAKLGKMLGADAIVLGSIVQFGRDDKSTNVGGSVFGDRLSRVGIGGVGQKRSKAVVALTARIVNVNTGEILAVANGKGESTRSGASLVGAGGGAGAAAAGALDMRSSNFAATVLGEAVNAAVANLTTQLNGSAGRLPTTTVSVEGLVADVSGNTLIINVGSKSGVKVGDKLKVSRVGREIRDPASGKVIKRITDDLGELTITEVDESSSVGTFSGAGAVKVGDAIKN
jgi:curli biogenesis system outer membrane secretion channel CsgG